MSEMTWDEFSRLKAEQDTDMRRQLAALDSPSGRELRRKLTLLEAYCRNCNSLVFYVVATSPYRVVRYWGLSPQELRQRWPDPPAGLAPEEEGKWRARHGDHGAPRKRQERMFGYVAEDDRDHLERKFSWVCKCRSGEFSMARLWKELDAGGDGKPRQITLL